MVPKGLSLLIIGDRKARKLIDTYLVLKAYSEGSKFENTTDAIAQAAIWCRRSIKTLHSRLKDLQAVGLIEYSKDGRFILVRGWKKLCEVYALDETRIRFYYVKHDKHRTVEDVLEYYAMKEKEKQCAQAALYKLNKSVEAKEVIEEVAGKTLDAVAHSQLFHDLTNKRELSPDAAFILFSVLRGDTSISSRTWSKLFSYTSKGGFAYKKRKLKAKGLITVEERQWNMDKGTHTTKDSRKCVSGSAVWKNKERSLVFIAPCKIGYLDLNTPAPASVLEKV